MLRDSLSQYHPPKPNDLQISGNFEVDWVLAFIDKHISGFPAYYQKEKDSVKENRISDILVHHLQLCKTEQYEDFIPFDFRKNPTQPNSDKETDIGVFVLTRSQRPLPIIEFEAKRLSNTSNNKEYVCGKRGGIERFKRGHHSSHLKICGMFGYVQSQSPVKWFEKVNSWIGELSQNNTDPTIDWAGNREVLIKVSSFPKVEKLYSSHFRKQSNDNIELWHYLIDLLEKNENPAVCGIPKADSGWI
jgi:hypothetical protein